MHGSGVELEVADAELVAPGLERVDDLRDACRRAPTAMRRGPRDRHEARARCARAGRRRQPRGRDARHRGVISRPSDGRGRAPPPRAPSRAQPIFSATRSTEGRAPRARPSSPARRLALNPTMSASSASMRRTRGLPPPTKLGWFGAEPVGFGRTVGCALNPSSARREVERLRCRRGPGARVRQPPTDCTEAEASVHGDPGRLVVGACHPAERRARAPGRAVGHDGRAARSRCDSGSGWLLVVADTAGLQPTTRPSRRRASGLRAARPSARTCSRR